MVTFRTAKSDAFLTAEGIILEDLFVNSKMSSINDALFCVHLPRQYSAARELDDFLLQLKQQEQTGQVRERIDKTSENFLNALRRGRDNEQKLNNRYMLNKKGMPVKFGDVIQLYHIKSGKYLTIKPTELANTERENIKVALNGKGNIYSGLVVMPRFKIDREGDVVSDNTDLFLTIAERRNEYLHCADRESGSGSLPEINCSLEPTPWKMSIFQSAYDAIDPSLILAAELIYIVDPEINAALMPTVERSESQDEAEAPQQSGDSEEEEEEGDEEGGERDDEEESMLKDENNSAKGEDEHRLVLKEMDKSGIIDTRSLWLLENRSKMQGGPILWRTSQVRIKNLCSGAYLKITALQHYDEDEELVTEYCVGTTMDPSEYGTLYSITEATSTTKLLVTGKAYSLKSENGGFLERGGDDAHIRGANQVIATREKNVATAFQLLKFGQVEVNVDDIKQQEPLDVYFTMASRDYLQKYFDMTVVPKASHITTLWPSADRSDMHVFLAVIARSITFSQGFPISAENIVLGVDKSDSTLAKARQTIMREQQILDLLHRIIELLIPISTRSDEIANLPKSQQPTLSPEEQAITKMGNMLLESSLSLLYYSILDHPTNQIHMANNIRSLLAHLGSQPLAGKCVTEMLSKNKELQETKIGDDEIAIFVDKLRSSKMNAMYLQLLRACCSCEGDGVDGNQCRVTEHLFANTNDIIIHIHADYTKITPLDWHPDGLYIPATPVPGSEVLSENLYLSGLPQLSLSWTTNSIDYSPLGLFGKLSVSVQELYRVAAPSTKAIEGDGSAQAQMLAAKKNQSVAQKEAVAGYFIAQILLCAEMCMDRNYVAMHRVDTLFTFDTLVTILKLNVQDQLKAAAARLLRCLYVDRDPQASTKIPVLTRTWSSVTKSSEPALPFVGESRKYYFGLLQQILAEYIDSMAGKPWTTLSKSMLELYSTLINFNFYGTIDRMQGVIVPLTKAVDRRTILFPGDPDYVVVPSTQKRDATIKAPSVRGGDLAIEESKEDPDATREEEMLLDDGAEGKDVYDSWQKRTYDALESIPYLLCILTLVLAAVIVTVWQILTQPDADEGLSTPVGAWGLIVLLIFISDVVVRGYCYRFVHGAILPFLLSAFNQIDILVISIDIIFLCLPNGGSSGNFTKTLRLVRLVRLLRLFRVAKIVSSVVESMGEVSVDSFQMPKRYSKAPMFELDAMVEIINTLLYANKIIADRNLSIFLKKFHDWESGEDTRSPARIFEDVIAEGRDLTLGVEDMDSIFLDIVMFIHKPLVQGALDIIMFHHRTRRTLLDNATKVQLLVSQKRERQFHQIQNMLQQLDRNAETHELWGELKSDADYAVNKQTKDILKELAELCRVRRFALGMFKGPFAPDTEIQNLLSNLGCFPICEKVLELLEGVEPDDDGALDEVAINTRDLCLLCNDLVFWFCLDNAHNQEQAYGSLEFFFDSLGAGINSHLVVRAIFSGNETLMKLVPHVHLSEMIDKIIKSGKSHHYLNLLLSITHVGDRNVSENQYEIIRVLTQGGRLAKVGTYLVPRSNKKYAEKVKLMAQAASLKDPSLEDLPPKLAYHLALMEIFAGCTSGRSVASSLEAKIQSVYNFTDAIECVLDMRSILIVRITTLKFLLNCVIDVSLPVPGLAESAAVWKLVNFLSDKLGKSASYFKQIHALGWDNPGISRHEAEFAILSVHVLTAFFEKNYDKNMFPHESSASGDEKVSLTQSSADAIIQTLFTRIRDLYDQFSPRLASESQDDLRKALVVLNHSRSKPVMAELEQYLISTTSTHFGGDKDAVELSGEKLVHTKYRDFLQQLQDSPEVQKAAEEENVEFITVLEQLPYVADRVKADVRYELLIKKLVSHVRENMSIIDNETRIDTRTTITTKWLIRSFRAMIENKMGMSIYERDDEGGEEQDSASQQVKTALNTCGATALCLDLIADGIDDALQEECIKLLVGLLFLEGGNREVQSVMNKYLSRPEAFLFFRQVRAILEGLITWHEWQGDIVLPEGEEPNLPEPVLIIRMLQLMSEGHYLPNQDLMREQPYSIEPANLLESLVSYLRCLSHHPCCTSTNAAIRISATIVEILQGPCKGNQAYLALNTDLLETCNRLMRAKRIADCVVEEEVELKKTVVDILEGILEGQNMHGQIYERVLSVMHVDVIQFIALEDGDPEEVQCDDYVLLKTECLVLLEMLVESKPSIKKEFGIPDDLQAAAGSNIGCVEVFWDNEMHRRYFHIPDVCALLSKASKDQLVAANNRDSQELKLIDFLDRAKGLYREVKHQELLVSLGLNAIYSRKNQERTTWFSFCLACVINLLYLAYYKYDEAPASSIDATISYPDSIATVIAVLNYMQLFSSFFTLSSMFVVRSPVVFQTFISEGMPTTSATLWTCLDPTTLYYIWYFTFSVLGITVNDQFITFLLLDLIMKNSTAQNVLNSIIVPAPNIFYALLITEIINYIFSFYLVSRHLDFSRLYLSGYFVSALNFSGNHIYLSTVSNTDSPLHVPHSLITSHTTSAATIPSFPTVCRIATHYGTV